MSENSKSCIKDAFNDVKHHKGIIHLIAAANEDEKICENLSCVYDYLQLAYQSLESIVRTLEE